MLQNQPDSIGPSLTRKTHREREVNYLGGPEVHPAFGHFPNGNCENVPRPVGRRYPALPLITFSDVSRVIIHWEGQMGDD